MTIIDDDIVVKIGDGEVVLENLGLRSWTAQIETDKKQLDQQIEDIVKLVIEVRGLTYKDGTPVTAESLKGGNVPVSFGAKLRVKWIEALVGGGKALEADSKNA